MAFDVFTREEIKVAKKLSWWGLLVIIGVAVFSGLVHVIDVYIHQGKSGLAALVQGTENKGASLKDSVDTEISKSNNIQKPTTVGELPLTLSIPSLGVNAKIQSPGAVGVEQLDQALKLGPVYYSGSGYPGVRNMLIFGHSTGFSVVHNQNYKVFNNLKNAKAGELIYVRSVSGVSTYKVLQVKKESKYSTYINFNTDVPMLTLSTCDSFGKASDRYVLEAVFVSFAAGK